MASASHVLRSVSPCDESTFSRVLHRLALRPALGRIRIGWSRASHPPSEPVPTSVVQLLRLHLLSELLLLLRSRLLLLRPQGQIRVLLRLLVGVLLLI